MPSDNTYTRSYSQAAYNMLKAAGDNAAPAAVCIGVSLGVMKLPDSLSVLAVTMLGTSMSAAVDVVGNLLEKGAVNHKSQKQKNVERGVGHVVASVAIGASSLAFGGDWGVVGLTATLNVVGRGMYEGARYCASKCMSR